MDFWDALAAHHVMPTKSCCTQQGDALGAPQSGCNGVELSQVPPAQHEGPIICLEHTVPNGKNSKIRLFFFFFSFGFDQINRKKRKNRNKMCLFAFYFILIRLTIPVLSKCLFQHFPAKEFLSLFKMTFRNKFNFRVLSTSV